MLYIVGTPIGNIKELSFRAKEVLESVELIAAEDTRRTAILLNEYGIKKPMLSYRKFNERECSEKVIDLLADGKDVALVSDAGMPLISDPGLILVDELIERGLPYTVVGGPCACIDALILSGMDTRSFCMLGFLPEKKSERDKLLSEYGGIKCPLIFYSSVHDIDKDLETLRFGLGARRVAVVREISKVYEEVIRFALGETPEFVHKGEFVIVVEGAPNKDYSTIDVLDHYNMYVAEGMTKKDAIKQVASDRGVHRSEVYAAVVKGEK